jgi:hypothetical protein
LLNREGGESSHPVKIFSGRASPPAVATVKARVGPANISAVAINEEENFTRDFRSRSHIYRVLSTPFHEAQNHESQILLKAINPCTLRHGPLSHLFFFFLFFFLSLVMPNAASKSFPNFLKPLFTSFPNFERSSSAFDVLCGFLVRGSVGLLRTAAVAGLGSTPRFGLKPSPPGVHAKGS